MDKYIIILETPPTDINTVHITLDSILSNSDWVGTKILQVYNDDDYYLINKKECEFERG